MDLHGIVSGAIGVVNPFVAATLLRSSGSYVTKPDGSRVPNFTTSSVSVQVQALSFSDLQKLDGLNIQGVRRAIYVAGAAAATIRPAQKGGDVLKFPAGTLPEGDAWLVVQVLEQWPDWAKFAITLQNNG